MLQPSWQELVTNVEIPARPTSGLWTKVCDYVEGPRKLQLVATGQWGYAAGKSCTPDGIWDNAPAGLLCPNAALGALIGKIGGSTADKPPDAATAVNSPLSAPVTFVVGSFCVISISDAVMGALFLSCNNTPDHIAANEGSIRVTIRDARA